MRMTGFAHLHEGNTAAELIDDCLEALLVPPFDCVITLTSCDNDPERDIFSNDLSNFRKPGFLDKRYVNVTMEPRRSYIHSELFAQELMKAVYEVPRLVIAPMNEGILALNRLGALIVQRYDIRVILP